MVGLVQDFIKEQNMSLFLKEHIYSIFFLTLTLFMALSTYYKHLSFALLCAAVMVLTMVALLKREWIVRRVWHWF